MKKSKLIHFHGSQSGLHIVLNFKHVDPKLFSELNFNNHGLDIEYLSDYSIERQSLNMKNTIILGFGHLSIDEIIQGVKNLKELMSSIN